MTRFLFDDQRRQERKAGRSAAFRDEAGGALGLPLQINPAPEEKTPGRALTAEDALRITHVSRQYRPGIGGLEDYVSNLARAQAAAGHAVRVVTLDRIFDGDGTRLPAHEQIDGVEVIRIPFLGSRRYPIAPAVLRHLGSADIVHVHALDFFADFLSLTRLIHHKPLVLSTHGGFFHTDFARTLKQLWFNSITRFTLSGMRAVIASSAQDAATFARVAGERVRLVENGVDVEKFAGLARPGSRTLLYFGRIAPNKRIDRLIAWFAVLVARQPQWRLIIAGKPMKLSIDTLRREAERQGVSDRISFHETPSDAALAALIGRSDVYACASSYEGFGIAAVEALSAGLYPLLSDIEAFRRTRERTGIGTLVDFSRPKETIPPFLADLAAFEANRPTQSLLRERIGAFAWGGVEAQIAHIYDDALGRRCRWIGRVCVQVATVAAARDHVRGAVEAKRPLIVAFCNAHSVNVASRDDAFVAALDRAYVLNDGIGVDIASRLRYGARFPTNLNGTDFTPRLLASLRQPTRVFLLGSGPGVAESASEAIAAINPNIRIVGTQHGFFAREDEERIAARIAASGADMVLVGMGSPRQELWAAKHGAALGAVLLCVGAYLDFTAGAVPRAPVWVRRLRCEWMFRLALEPGRLARRYLFGNAHFLLRTMWRSK